MKSAEDKLKEEARYWMRVFIVGKAIAIGWRNLPVFFLPVLSSGKEFASDLWRLLLGLLLPLTFIGSPFWLWMLEKEDKERKERRIEAIKKMVNREEEWE